MAPSAGRRAAALLLAVWAFVALLHGSGAEVPPKPPTGVTIVSPVKPDGGPQAFPDAAKANLPVFTMDYPRIQIPFEITLWVLLASFAKIGEFLPGTAVTRSRMHLQSSSDANQRMHSHLYVLEKNIAVLI